MLRALFTDRYRIRSCQVGAGSECQDVRSRHVLSPKNRYERSFPSPRDIPLGLHNPASHTFVCNCVTYSSYCIVIQYCNNHSIPDAHTPVRPPAVIPCHRAPTQWRSFCTIAHLPHPLWFLDTIDELASDCFRAPSCACPMVVLRHHHKPALPRFLCTIALLFSCGFDTPSRTCPKAAFIHHRLPIRLWFLHTTTHPPNGSFFTPAHTHPMVVLIHHHHRVQRWFLHTTARPPNGGFFTPSRPSNGGFYTPPPTHPTAVF